MKKYSKRYIVILIILLMLSAFSVQRVSANGVRVTTEYDNAKYKVTLTSREAGKGIKIVAFSTANGKNINVTYAFDKKASASASLELEEAMVIAPFRVITTNTDDLNYRPFKDILNTEADNYIRHLHDIGVTDGFSDGTFRPENTLTRAEAAVMLSQALKLQLDSTSDIGGKYKDTGKHWAGKHIAAVAEKGIMTGFADKTFRPDNKITVAEVCTIISKSFEFKTKSKGVFTKLKKNQWYSEYVQNIFDLQILTPSDSIYKSFNEGSNISRGNFAIMLSRALSTY
ncbi:S-layer family protein [Ruminiclostridium sufflavum DSM 19573]|uniref:S-layer family protein n=1 Tax=Ruminiclostridium sufflavum DSM 19573 TaxID=1121337 RepID=A0A318XT36_9FIRM|nr:S-layer homology domain-containing protein [Ruminiclostridium sufflavum]PYG89521.1 S-layer family protein [Ruminiclostridium sufflavum DSM 19573]